MPFVDIHAHLLPGLDDGPGRLEQSLEMARTAAREGTGIIVVTPHQRDVMLNSSVQRVREIADLIGATLAKEAVQGSRRVRLLIGMENHIEPDLPGWFEQGKALTINRTRFILAEPPFTAWPPYVDAVLHQLIAKRLVPVIAHPERNVVLQRSPDRVRELAENGMIMQVTGASILGSHGPAAQTTAVTLLRKGLVHVVASDMHLPGPNRGPSLQAAFLRVAQLVGEAQATMLFETNPLDITEDRRPEPSRALLSSEPRQWWHEFLPWRTAGRVRDLFNPIRWRGRGG